MTRVRRLHLARVVLLLGSGVASAGAMAQGAAKPPPVVVEIATARAARVAPRAWIPGSIVSREDARVAGIVAGRVQWIAEVGQRVEAGGVLARLDDTVVKLRTGELRAQVARAQAQADLARAQLNRYEDLAATKIYPANQLDEARAQLDMARHDVVRLSSQLNQAEYEMQQSVIRAPFAGVVTERFTQRGEYLQVGAAVARVVNTGDLEARATAALAFAANVKAGQAAAIRAGTEERHGTVRAVVPVGDDRSRQFEVRLALPKSQWPVGTAIEVSVPTGPDRDAVVVPRDAIVIRQTQSYVMRVGRNGTVERREVDSGSAVENLVEIRSGVAVGDQLVIRGAERLEPGQAVTVAQPRSAAATSSIQ